MDSFIRRHLLCLCAEAGVLGGTRDGFSGAATYWPSASARGS